MKMDGCRCVSGACRPLQHCKPCVTVSRITPDGKHTTVVNQLIAALVALLKRGWLEHPEQRRDFFQVL